MDLKNTITEMKNTIEGINSRLEYAEEWTSDLEDKVVEITQSEQQKEKRLKNEDSLRDLWNKIKHTNIHMVRVQEGKEREKTTENLSEEITAENFPNLVKETDI